MQDPGLMALLKDTQTALEAVQNVKETDRARKYQAHLSVVNEGIPGLGWVMVVRRFSVALNEIETERV